MKISFHGATREVTGSCYLVQTDETRILVDCGMFQGGAFCEAKNAKEFDFDPSTVDAVIITHAHLDHTGRLPRLVKEGFKGPIYLTPPTGDLAKLVLEDAYNIMMEEFKREYRPPLYAEEHIEQALNQFKRLDYSRSVSIGDVSFRLRDAGHIFGSAFVEITQRGGGKATFSGDLGNENVPILRPTAQLAETDVVIMESTYGNRVHEDESTRTTKLKSVVEKTIKQKGVLVIPAFAIERTQQILYELNHLVEKRIITPIDVYLDSPMAIGATQVIKAYPQYYDPEALQLVSHGDDMFDFPGLHICQTRDQSKAINEAAWPKIIISGSGMMNGGRILHHLVRYLSNPKTTLLIIGYQSPSTLGHKLYRGDKIVQVMGERVDVRATVTSIGAYSAHADQNKLVSWIANAAHKPSHIYCTHGEEGAAAALATRLQQELGVQADVPRYGDIINV
jgi:metallo-beta-lactamase family protein